MKNKNKGFATIAILGIILGVLVIGGGAYYVATIKNLEKEKVEDVKNTENKESIVLNKEEYKNNDIYPKVFEYGDKKNQLLVKETIEGYAAPNIFSVNKEASILFRDYYGIKIFSQYDGLRSFLLDDTISFKYAYMDDKENIYILNDFQPEISIITKYNKAGEVVGFFNDERLRKLFDRSNSSNPLFDQLYIINDNLYLYSKGSQDSYKIGTINGISEKKDIVSEKVLGKYGISGDLFYTRIDSKKGYDYLKVTQSNGKEKEFSFENKRVAGFFFLNEDRNGNVYVRSDSCGAVGEVCVSKIYKINKINGNIIGIKELPKSYYVSHNSLFVDNDGNIFYLNLQKDKAYLEKYYFDESNTIVFFNESDNNKNDVIDQPAYLKSVYLKDGKSYIDVDYIQMFNTKEEEKLAAVEDGFCKDLDTCNVYNNGYKRNNNPLIRTFEVEPNASIYLHGGLAGYLFDNMANWNPPIKISELLAKKIPENSNINWNNMNIYIRLDVRNNKISKIIEPYQE